MKSVLALFIFIGLPCQAATYEVIVQKQHVRVSFVLESQGVKHKLTRSSGSEKTSVKINTRSAKFLLKQIAEIKALPSHDPARCSGKVIGLFEGKSNKPVVGCYHSPLMITQKMVRLTKLMHLAVNVM